MKEVEQGRQEAAGCERHYTSVHLATLLLASVFFLPTSAFGLMSEV
jgi:hypothetical protein